MLRLLFAALLIAPTVVAAPVPKEEEVARLRRLYGAVLDPSKDCKVELDKDRLRITVHGGVHWLDVPNRPNHPIGRGQSAPRVLKDATGDFVATVRITFPIRPAPKDGANEQCHAGGGLVVWSGQDDFVTWTRGEVARTGKSWREWGMLRVTQKGSREDGRPVSEKEGESVYLRISRKGQSVVLSDSPDGKKWEEHISCDVNWEKTVRVGLMAMNASGRPFSATFDEYTITTPKK